MFELFDFNEIRTISKTDLEFLLYCCVSSALKIYGYADENPKDSFIHELVLGALSCSRVTLDSLLHFCSFSDDINQFLYFFKIKGLTLPKPIKKQDLFEPLRGKSSYPLKTYKIDPVIQKKIIHSSKSWISAVVNPLSKLSTHNPGTGKFALHFVLGISSEKSKHSIGIFPGNDIILYFISSVVVILYCKLLKQKHYLEHTTEIASISIGKDIACTGESGITPKIHVWRISTLETLQILSGIHQTSITLLGFTNNENHLISCSSYTVVIYEWRTKTILVTTNHIYPISDLYLLPRVTSSSCFVLGCDEEITVYSIQKDKLNVSSVNLEVSMCKSPICCLAGQGIYNIQKEGTFLLLTGHSNGSVLLWENIEFQKIIVVYESSICALCVMVNWYAIATRLGIIYIWDSKLEACQKVIELSMFPFKLMSFEVNSMKYENKKLYISTRSGDIIENRIQLDHLKFTPKRIGGIIQIPNNQNCLAFLSSDLPFLMIGGESGVIITVDLRSFEIIDTWAIGYCIRSLICEKFGENMSVVAGCEEGYLFIRENWDAIFQPEAGKASITDVKFINNGNILVVASEDSNLYMFRKGSSYERIYILTIEAGIPVSLNPSKNETHLLIITDKRKLMMMNGETYALNFTFEDVAGIEWNKLHTFFYANLKDHLFRLPVVWNSKGDIIAASGFEGVHVWKEADRIQLESGTILKGHIESVSDLCLKSNILLTLGHDQMIMYWKYEKVSITVDDNSKIEISKTLKQESAYALSLHIPQPSEFTGQFLQSAFLTTVVESSVEFFNQAENQKPALLSLDLKHIYGGKTHLRYSLFYIHLHTPETPPTCYRHLIYYTSRYPILFNPVTQSQSFYTNHKAKVTALDINQELELAATCESSIPAVPATLPQQSLLI